MKYGYAHEKFSDAVHVLATSPMSLQDRIAAAFVSITAVEVGPSALPDDVANQLRTYHAAWNAARAAPGEGTINAWARTLRDDEAVEIAKWFLSTEYRLRDSPSGKGEST